MAKVEFVSGKPAPYSNHVLIERTHARTFRFEGVSNAFGREPVRFASRHYRDLDEVKVAAATWAHEYGVTVVYVPADA